MTNNSSTGGYLYSAPLAPLPANLTFTQFLQQVFVGISGLLPQLVRPLWQVNPPKQPDLYTNWMALGVKANTPDANAFNGTISATYPSGTIQLGCNPADGVILTVNGTAITFVVSSPTGNQVLIGADQYATASNLYTFLTASIDTNINKAFYAVDSNVVTETFRNAGSAGNAFTLVSSSPQILLSGATLMGGGDNLNTMQRHEELEIQCSFYGPNASDYADIVRDGFQVPQNLEGLRSANMGFVGTSPAMQVPDLVNERWIDRFNMSVFLRREIIRSYPVLTFLSVSVSATAELSQGTKTVAWTSNA